MKGYDFRLACIIVVLLFVCACITGCITRSPVGSNSTSPASEQYKTPLIFRITWKAYSGRGEAIQKIVNSYNAGSNQRYDVQLIDGDEDFGALNGMLKNGLPADIYALPYRYVQYFGDKGLLLDVTDAFQSEKGCFYPNLWNLGVVDAQTFGVPWLGHSIALVYNKNLLDRAGVDPQQIRSLNDLVASCEKVEASTGVRGIGLVGANHNDVSWMVNQFVYGFGSSLVDKEGRRVTVNNAKAEAAIDFYKNVLGKHAQPTWVNDTGIEVMDYFRQQKVAFELQGLWGVTDIWKNGSPFEVGVIALENIGLYSEVGPIMLALPTNISGEKKEAAIRFIRFLISKEAQETIMDGEYSPEHDAYYPFRTPVRQDLADSLVFQEYPEFKPFLVGFRNPSIDVPVPNWQMIKEQYYAPGLHQVMGGETKIKVFLKTIEIEGNKILAEPEQ